MWKFGILLIMPLLLLTACQKDRIKPFFKLEFGDGTQIYGKTYARYLHRPDSPCHPDTCFSLIFEFNLHGSIAMVFIEDIPLQSGQFKFHRLRSLAPRQEWAFNSIMFYPRYPGVHKNDPNAWNYYLAIEDDFNEFVITHLDLGTGKVEGHFGVNLMKYPSGYLHTGGWPQNFVSDTVQIKKGTFLGELKWH